jgi:hypothetical protein
VSSFRSSGSGVRSGASGSTGSSGSGVASGVSSTRSGAHGVSSGFRTGSGSVARHVGSIRSGSVSGGFSSFFRLVRAGRESENASGGSSSENDLAHVWYSLNSEWTTHGQIQDNWDRAESQP